MSENGHDVLSKQLGSSVSVTGPTRCHLPSKPASGEGLADDFGLADQGHRPALKIGDGHVGVDAQEVVDHRPRVLRVIRPGVQIFESW